MKRHRTSLSESFAKTIARPGRYTDGSAHGLSLLVRKTNVGLWSKTWCQRLKVNGTAIYRGLGSYPKVSFKTAEAKALANAYMAAEGKLPETGATVPTFEEAAEKVHTNSRGAWRAGTPTGDKWIASLQSHVFPQLGRMPVNAITARDVLGVLQPIWKNRLPTAKRVRQRIRKVLDWCLAHEYVEENVADARIDAALPREWRKPVHFLALPYQGIRAALVAVDACGEMLATKLCIRFLILTVARSGEARGQGGARSTWTSARGAYPRLA